MIPALGYGNPTYAPPTGTVPPGVYHYPVALPYGGPAVGGGSMGGGMPPGMLPPGMAPQQQPQSDLIPAPAADPASAIVAFNATVINHLLIVGGGVSGAEEMRALEACGVTACVSMADNLDDTALCVPDHVDFYHVPWADDGQAKPVEDLLGLGRWAVTVLEQTLVARKRMPVYYVHCAAGVNRGPSGAAFLLALLSGMDGAEAFAQIRLRRPQAHGYLVPAYRATIEAALAAARVGAVILGR